ncbi:MAG: hypothetical protein ABIJ57_03725, partial [Pseudomonadota bacterium]
TSSRQVGDVSPGRRSNRKALDPFFQYAALCEFNDPPAVNLLASARFLAIICCIPGLLSHDLGCLIAQTIRAAVLFQLICICVHAPDSQFRGQSFQLVSFLKVHFPLPPILFGFPFCLYILQSICQTLGYVRIIISNNITQLWIHKKGQDEQKDHKAA